MMDEDQLDPIARDYLRRDRQVEAERQAHLAAGKPAQSFKPQTLVD